jgi:hypothetical protein
MQIDFNATQLSNADFSISVSFESDPNVSDDKEEQEEKHPVQRTSTDDGIQMDFNAIQPVNAQSSI